MESRVKLFGHPIHPMLIVFPLGLLATAVIFDILYMMFGNPAFPTVSYWLIAAGLVGGLLAALFGLIDWLGIPASTRAKRVGLLHGAGNAIVLVLFLISLLMRRSAPGNIPDLLATVWSFLGAGLAIVTGWLGGELVYRLDVGVDTGANLDAPSSLTYETPTDDRVQR